MSLRLDRHSLWPFVRHYAVLIIIVALMVVPVQTAFVPLLKLFREHGHLNTEFYGIWLAHTAFGLPLAIFLFRNFFITLPKDLIEAARMDKASEWQIYWRIVMPLTLPALAVLAIFSIMWRWNEFLWPLAVLTKTEVYTLQIGLNAFQGELQTQWHYLLAMTVVTLIPIALVFVFLQRFITTGIGSTGMK